MVDAVGKALISNCSQYAPMLSPIGDLLFPYSALHGLQLFFRHTLAGGKVACRDVSVHAPGYICRSALTCGDLGIDLDAGIGGD